MKKVLVLLLCFCMMLGMLTACGKKEGQTGTTGDQTTTVDTDTKNDGKNTDSNDTADTADDENKEPVEIKKIVLTYATTGVEAPDMLLVQEEINKISRDAIGVEVEFMPISIFELASTVPTKVLGGEQIDIFMMAFTGNKLYEDMNLLEPLNEYMTEENTPYICVTAGATSGWRCIYDHVEIYNRYVTTTEEVAIN